LIACPASLPWISLFADAARDRNPSDIDRGHNGSAHSVIFLDQVQANPTANDQL